MPPTRRALPSLAAAIALAACVTQSPTPGPGEGPSREAPAAWTPAAREAAPFETSAEWIAFCERLARTGEALLREGPADTPTDRAEAHRYLLQRLVASIDEVLEAATEPPVVALYSHKLRKFGMDSADAKYSTARIDPTGTYRLHGSLGTAHHITLQLVSNAEGYRAFDSLALTEQRDRGEALEVRVSAERPAGWTGAWLPLDPRARELLFREYFYDWDTETPSTFLIERLDDPGRSPRVDVATMQTLMEEVASTFEATVPKWLPPAMNDRLHSVNQLGPPRRRC